MAHVEILLHAVVAFSIGAHALMMVLVYVGPARRLRRRSKLPASEKSEVSAGPVEVSIFKPLAGVDDDLVENLESFAHLRGPSYELLLGVASTDDPAFDVAKRFIARHPNRPFRLILTEPNAAVNPKVAQLIGIERQARGTIFVVSDSNVRVDDSYLETLADRLSNPNVGLVSNVIVGSGERTLGAALENYILLTHVAPGVISTAVFGRPITIGKSLAMWRSDLESLGGFRALGFYLAEDHALARWMGKTGRKVVVEPTPIENRNRDGGLARPFRRHSRWAKIRRSMCPVAFWFEPLLHPVVVAALVLAVVPSTTTVGLLAVAVMSELVVDAASILRLRGFKALWLVHLLPVKALFMFVCYCRALVSRRVTWRGNALRVTRDSRLVTANDQIPLAVGSDS